MKTFKNLFASALIVVTVSACSSTPEREIAPVEDVKPVEQLYNQAMATARAGAYEKAARQFDEVERQHPYSVWAVQGQLMAAYALYQANNYDDSIAALDRFIRLNPGNPNAAYAHYLKGLSYYEQITDVGRDQFMTRRALETFDILIKRFPEGKYTRDARLKVDLTRNHLAGKEMAVGRYYANRGQYLAAINRFRAVVEKFDTTEQVPEALHRLTELYLVLGLKDEARRAAALLSHNYPGSEWYSDSYAVITTGKSAAEEKDLSVFDRMWSGLSGLF